MRSGKCGRAERCEKRCKSVPSPAVMFINFVLYFLGILVFKFYVATLFNYDKFFDWKLPEHEHYDYIVVGSGSAGSIVASGLKGKVLVIEAGNSGDSVFFNIPIVQPLLQRSSYDWSYETSPQQFACKGLKNNQSLWPMGKIQGGSHRLNNMIYHRGHSTDYASFITDGDANEWFEDYESKVPVSEGSFRSTISDAFVMAGKELGFDDFFFTNLAQLNGRRYTQIDHWRTLQNPPEICFNAAVTRILFDDVNTKRAIGIEYQKKGELHQVYAEKIILSAGAIGSPKILLHSGIGPRDHLEDIGIEVRENLPVGENLQDHVSTGLDLIMLNQTAGLSVIDMMNPFKVLDYFWFGGDGSPLSFAGCDAMGFVKLNESNETPDLSFMLIPASLSADHGLHLRKIINLRDDIWSTHFMPMKGQTTITILPVLLHPKSRGTIRLRSANFLDPPLINPNYLKDDDDVKKLITGIRIIEKLIETPSMQKFGAEMNPKRFPGCEKFFFDSNDYWECFVRHITMTTFHPVGTCKLGDYDDSSTVVLKDFRVKNLENLFVVDGSIIPMAPSANPHAIISMLAQKFVHDMSP